jgi:NAD(P)-dependent dehydrogenase (short-subunit alcohol dehydrogenase family)
MTGSAGRSVPSVAVVTGASRGLGAGLAKAFARAGIRLGLCARAVPAVPPGGDALVDAVDVADAAGLAGFADRVVDRFGLIDLWVNNAGVLEPVGPLSQSDPEQIRRNIEVNVCGTLFGSAAFARHVRGRAGGGLLVNISSGAATTPYQGWAAYCASKAAVAMASEVTALDESAFGLRVVALAPGLVDTEMQAAARNLPVETFPAGDRFRAAHRLGAFNSPAWIAAYILDHCWGEGPDALTGPAGMGPVRIRVPDEHPGATPGASGQKGEP